MKENIEFADDGFRLELVDDEMSAEDRKKEIQELIKMKDDLLHSFGFFTDKNDNVCEVDPKIVAGIVGFSVGDAFGVPVEGFTRERLEKIPLSEMIGYCNHRVPVGTWSDDTSMVLATMDSIIEKNGIDYNDMMFKFSEWFNNSKYTAIDRVFDAGYIVRTAISNYQNGIDAILCGEKNYDSNGNGSLMRMLPIAYYLYYSNYSEEEEVEIINKISSLTHAHEISCLGCKIFSDFTKQLLGGSDKYQAIDFVKNINYEKYYSFDTVSAYKRILKHNIATLDKSSIRSSGYVVDSLEASLWSTFNSKSYEESVLLAVNLGGDTDTIGAITGGINGIIYGRESIPDRWLKKMKRLDYIEEFTNKFGCSLNFLSDEPIIIGSEVVDNGSHK